MQGAISPCLLAQSRAGKSALEGYRRKGKTMLTYFPEIYPGELLYSTLGRLRCHSGILSPKLLLDDVFNSCNVRAGVFLQAKLGQLAANIPPSRGLTAQVLALETT